MTSALVTLTAWVKNTRWLSHLVTLLLFVAVIVGMNAWRTRDVPPMAPDFSGVMVDGRTMTLTQFRALHPGKPVALHVWADWCPVCRTEQNSISRLAGDKDIPLLTIAMQSGDAVSLQKVLVDRNLAWPVLVDDDGKIAAAYHLPGVPSFVVIDAQGRIADVQVGYTSEIGMRMRLWWAGISGA